MTIKELTEQLQNYSDDTQIMFYDWLRGDDMFLKDISISDDGDEIYLNISR